MPAFRDLTGQTFGKIYVVRHLDGRKNNSHMWECKCTNCGATFVQQSNVIKFWGACAKCRTYSDIGERSKKYNECEVVDDYVKIYSEDRSRWMICDIEDWECLKHCYWNEDKDGYWLNGKRERFHNLVVSCPDGLMCDHVRGQRWDNRKQSLRLATPQQNSQNKKRRSDNKSGCTGVWWWKDRQVYQVHVASKTIGYFKTKEAAHAAYECAAAKAYGEFKREAE